MQITDTTEGTMTMTTRCEDFPCCGHEPGDCNGELYGSDASIMNDPHLYCDHNTGYCEVWDNENDEDEDEDEDSRDEAEIREEELARYDAFDWDEEYYNYAD